MFVIIDGNFVIFVIVCICGLSEIEEIKILEEDMQQQTNITWTNILSHTNATTMDIHNFTPYLFHHNLDACAVTIYSPLPMILTTKNVSRKKWRGAKWTDFWTPKNAVVPSWWKKRGNDCDIAVGNCVYAFPSQWFAWRWRHAAGTREEGGNPGREILFLAALERL